MHKILFFLLVIISVGYTETPNKKIINQYFNQDKCLNFNENYLCINTESKTNKLKNILKYLQTQNPYDYSTNFTEEKINKFFEKKLKISDQKVFNDSIYDNQGNLISKGYKKYSPVYNKKLSVDFNQALWSNFKYNQIEDSKKLLDSLLSLEDMLQPILGLIKRDSLIIRVTNYDEIYIHINKDIYNFIQESFFEDFQNLDLIEYKFEKRNTIQTIESNQQVDEVVQENIILSDGTILKPPPLPVPAEMPDYYDDYTIAIKHLNNIIKLFKKNLYGKINDKNAEKIDKEISFLISESIRNTIYGNGSLLLREPFEERALYLYKKAFQILVDYVSLEKNERQDLLIKLSTPDIENKIQDLFYKPKRIIEAFYKNYPLKVFITKRHTYHSPFTDGVYGYLYIHHSDIDKLQRKDIKKYLFMHEKEHILRHFTSPKKNMIDSIERTKMGDSMVNFISALYQVIEKYDSEQYIGRLIFKEEMRELKEEKSKLKKEVFQKFSLLEQEMIKSLSEINYNEILSPYEEINIDLSNMNDLDFYEKKDYYFMLKMFLPKNHKRLIPIQLNMKLSKIEQSNSSTRTSQLIRSANSYLQYNQLIGSQDNNYKSIQTLLGVVDSLGQSIYELKYWGEAPLNFETFMNIYKGEEKDQIETTTRKNELSSLINELYNIQKLEIILYYLREYLKLKEDYTNSYIDYINSSFYTGEL